MVGLPLTCSISVMSEGRILKVWVCREGLYKPMVKDIDELDETGYCYSFGLHVAFWYLNTAIIHQFWVVSDPLLTAFQKA